MAFSAQARAADIWVRDVVVGRRDLSVALMDGRTIIVPPSWYPAQRSEWEPAGAGYGIHWPQIDEDLSTEGLLLGNPAPLGSESWRALLADAG
jgi:hypothetical protein